MQPVVTAATAAPTIAPPTTAPAKTSEVRREIPTPIPAPIPAPTTAPSYLPDWAIGPFARPDNALPILSPDPSSVFDCPMRRRSVKWEALHAFNPAAIVREGKVFLLYRAEDDTGNMQIGLHTSRIGLAVSDDGIRFKPVGSGPVLYPDNDDQKANEWTGGCEDPRIVETAEGSYVLTYTQWNHEVPRLAIATSDDLVHWKKHGPAFIRVSGEKYAHLESKSGGIVTSMQDGRPKAVKINDRYWMFWGEHTIRLAWSDNLIDWHMVEDSKGEPLLVFKPTVGEFDSPLAEVGPPPLLTDRGILLLYNGKNDGRHRIPNLSKDAYSAGQLLFDKTDPTRRLDHLRTPFLKPELPWERSGQYAAGTTFIEGFVRFHDKWFLYYGCADSRVGVAICD